MRISRPGISCACILAALVAAGCASESTVRRYVPQIVTPYRIDIQQGNFVTQDMVDKLAVGQTREQVRFILGTPVLSDIFHARRWDYVFRITRGWGEPQSRKLVVFFDEAGKLERWESDLPVQESKVPPPDPAAAPANEPPAPRASAGEAPPKAAEPPPAGPPQSRSESPPNLATVAPPTPGEPSTSGGSVATATAVAAPSPPTASAGEAASPRVEAGLPPAAPAAPSAPAAVASVPSGPGTGAAVLAAVERWRSAWSARDVEAYLSMYATSFRPPAGMTRAQWSAQRKERLKRAGRIDVKVVDARVELRGSDEATAQFTQIYESDVLKESGRKTLALVNDRGDWRIRSESFEK